MLNKLTLILMSILSTLLFFACNKPIDPEYKSVSDLKVENFTLKELQLSANINFYNPNKAGINVKDIMLDVWINEKYLGQINQSDLVKVEKESDFSIPIVLTTETNKLLDGISLFLEKNLNLNIHIKGSVRFGYLGVFKKIPLDFKTQHTVSL